MKSIIRIECNENGFTLIELLVAIFIGLLLSALVYGSFAMQQRSYLIQEQVTAIQQNLRGGMSFLEDRIRLAGLDPRETEEPGIELAESDRMQFTLDWTDDAGNEHKWDGDTGDKGEDILFALNTNRELTIDDINSGTGAQAISEDIDALDFIYYDEDRNVLNGTSGDVSSLHYDRIFYVTVTMVGRAHRPDPRYTDTTVYKNINGMIILAAQNDHFRRQLLSKTIQFRNLKTQNGSKQRNSETVKL